jgi:hypothetical protein
MEPADRPTIDISSAVGGWPRPWPAVAELAALLQPQSWTLVGGLMTQLHTINNGFGVVRPTDDVDIVLHIETTRGLPDATASALRSIGYDLRDTIDPRDNTAHRFIRNGDVVDLVTSTSDDNDNDGDNAAAGEDVVDVLIADHHAPRVTEKLLGRDMIQIEGGTQALKRTINARLEIIPGAVTTVSVPRPLGAVILKAAAYRTDSRDRDRHLADAAALLACIEDPFAERDSLAGSDRRRLRTLQRELPDDHVAWLALPEAKRNDARAVLRLLNQV